MVLRCKVLSFVKILSGILYAGLFSQGFRQSVSMLITPPQTVRKSPTSPRTCSTRLVKQFDEQIFEQFADGVLDVSPDSNAATAGGLDPSKRTLCDRAASGLQAALEPSRLSVARHSARAGP